MSGEVGGSGADGRSGARNMSGRGGAVERNSACGRGGAGSRGVVRLLALAVVGAFLLCGCETVGRGLAEWRPADDGAASSEDASDLDAAAGSGEEDLGEQGLLADRQDELSEEAPGGESEGTMAGDGSALAGDSRQGGDVAAREGTMAGDGGALADDSRQGEDGAAREGTMAGDGNALADDPGKGGDGAARDGSIVPVGEKPVTVAFTGDVLLSDGILANFDREGIEGILDKRLVKELRRADVAVINNEFAFSERGRPAKDKQFTFRVAPKRAGILRKMGVDVASLANNHSLDYGEDALLDTIDTLKEVGISPIGAGRDEEEAGEILYVEEGGLTLAFLAASRVIPVPEWTATDSRAGLLTTYDPAALLGRIEEADQNADFVIVVVHWGLERKSYPEEYQRELGRMYAEAGADLVVGSHSHCLQGIEYIDGVPVVYSLGNFLFGETISGTALLKATFEAGEAVALSLIPCEAEGYRTFAVGKKEKEAFFRSYEELCFGVDFWGGTAVPAER